MTRQRHVNRPAAREGACDRVRRLRTELDGAAPPAEPAQLTAARAELEAAEQALRKNPDPAHPDHLKLSGRFGRARAAFDQAGNAHGHADSQLRAQLRHEVHVARQAAQREISNAHSRLLEAAVDRANADERTVEHAAADFDALRAGLVRLKVEEDETLRLVIEAIRNFEPLKPGEAVIGSVGNVSLRGRDRRPATVIVHLRADGAALVAVPVYLLEPIPEGIKGR